ncbi:right-handed parallel beta-helix repeat-containing protein [Rhodopirellula baltica]
MLFVKQKRDASKSKRRRRLLTESLEMRAMLTTFYVDGDLGSQGNDGSAQAPFSSITQGIQAAMQNAGEDEIVIAPRAAGTPYVESVSLAIHGSDLSPITVRGATGSAADVVWTTNFGPGMLVDADLDFTVKDLKFNQMEMAGLRVVSDANVTVENVHIMGSRRNSGIVHQNGDLVVRDSLLEGNFQGLWSAALRDDQTDQIIDYPDNLTVDNTVTTNNNANGIFMANSTGDVLIQDVQATGNRFNGVRVWQMNSISVDGGEYSENGYSGLSFEASDSPSVTGGMMQNNGHHGLWAVNVQAPSISGSLMAANAFSGIYLGSSPNTYISQTAVEGNGEHGIKVFNADGIVIDQVIATDNGSIVSSSTRGGGGIGISPATAAPIVISNSTVSRNQTRGNGGGIEVWAWNQVNYGFTSNVAILNTEVTENQIAPDINRHGGGVALFGSINASLDQVLIEGNVARGTAGLHSFGAFTTPDGYPSMTVLDSTIANNIALREGPGIGAGAAGVYHGSGYVHISGSTIHGNDGGNAGGVYLAGLGGSIGNSTISGNDGVIVGGLNSRVGREELDIRNVTIVDNHGGDVGGIISVSDRLQIGNSIVAMNTTDDPGQPTGGAQQPSDFVGNATTLGGNFFGESDQVQFVSLGQDQSGTTSSPLDPDLGPLQDNGGFTLTHAPLPGSPVVDGGDDALVTLLATDQRGLDRVEGNAVDIGAVEQRVFDADLQYLGNRLNLNSADKGNKTVSIVLYSTNEVDASLIDVSSVVWASATASGSQLRDVDGDGALDLVLDFKLKETDLVDHYRNAMMEDDSDNEVTVEVPLTALNDQGLRVLGSASVDLKMTGRALRELLDSIGA